MTESIYCIFDMLADEAGPVLCCRNDAVARRAFRTALKDADIRDYRLYRVGTYDTVTCRITGTDPTEIAHSVPESEVST